MPKIVIVVIILRNLWGDGMVSKKYKVLRSRVYLGEVVIPQKINVKENYSEVLEYRPIRYSLFELDENNKANDLLNKVPNYKIADYSSELDLEELCIAHSVYLGYLLEYLDFNEELDYEDLCYIRHLIFSGNFSKKFPEVFGIIKDDKRVVRDNPIIDTYYLRLFDSLEKSSIGDVIIGSSSTVDPFKMTFMELKKKLFR